MLVRWLLSGLGIVASLLFAGATLGNWGGAWFQLAVSDLGLVGFALFAALCALIAAIRNEGSARLTWGLLSVGSVAWASGAGIWAYRELVLGWTSTPLPSVSDAGFIVFPIAAGAALVLLPTDSVFSRARLVLDGVIVAASLFLVSWVAILRDLYSSEWIKGFALVTAMAYPIAGIVVVTMAIIVLARVKASHRVAVSLLAGGLALMALSDAAWIVVIARGGYHSGIGLDLGWMAGFLVLAGAALAATRKNHDDQFRKSGGFVRYLLPYIPLVIAGAVATSQLIQYLPPGPVPVIALGLVVVVLVRQFVVVSEDRRRLIALSEQALRDPLTGLANRVLFTDRLVRAVESHAREGRPVSILSIDLDGFKPINDTFGHAAGDALLIGVAARLEESVPKFDTVARFGGDEFIVLIEGERELPLQTYAERVLGAFGPPFLIDGHKLSIRPSIGLAELKPGDTETSAEALLKQADAAMYTAKRVGTGRIHAYTPNLGALNEQADWFARKRRLQLLPNAEDLRAGAVEKA